MPGLRPAHGGRGGLAVPRGRGAGAAGGRGRRLGAGRWPRGAGSVTDGVAGDLGLGGSAAGACATVVAGAGGGVAGAGGGTPGLHRRCGRGAVRRCGWRGRLCRCRRGLARAFLTFFSSSTLRASSATPRLAAFVSASFETLASVPPALTAPCDQRSACRASAQLPAWCRRPSAGRPCPWLGACCLGRLGRSARCPPTAGDRRQKSALCARMTSRASAVGHCVGVVGRWHRQHRTGLQPVHVVAHERVGVAAEQRDQHLVERHPGALALRWRCDTACRLRGPCTRRCRWATLAAGACSTAWCRAMMGQAGSLARAAWRRDWRPAVTVDGAGLAGELPTPAARWVQPLAPVARHAMLAADRAAA